MHSACLPAPTSTTCHGDTMERQAKQRTQLSPIYTTMPNFPKTCRQKVPTGPARRPRSLAHMELRHSHGTSSAVSLLRATNFALTPMRAKKKVTVPHMAPNPKPHIGAIDRVQFAVDKAQLPPPLCNQKGHVCYDTNEHIRQPITMHRPQTIAATR